jgi:tetratricopeptide (TPR) repeat protein
MDARTAEECIEVLSSVAQGEGADTDVLQALVIVGLAQPKLAERVGLGTVAIAHRLVAALERGGEIDRGLALLEILKKHFPSNESLERDLTQLMRRQGMVKDLVGRYYERARTLMREGRHAEAAGWLREVLQLDPTRKDAARLMRDLRIKRASRTQKKSGGWRTPFVLVLLVLGGAWVVLRELRLRAEFAALPTAAPGNEAALERRLADLERFMTAHPIWHGGLSVLNERATLRLELAQIAEAEQERRSAEERAAAERLESADLCRTRGLGLAQSGDLRGALQALREALIYGGADWPPRERVERDVADLEASLAEQP